MKQGLALADGGVVHVAPGHGGQHGLVEHHVFQGCAVDLVLAAMAIGRASAASDPVVDLYDDPDFKPENAIFSW